MLLLLYTSLFSYMLFFSICIAPVINVTLDSENSSKLLRKIFPKNFIYGGIISFITLLTSIYYKDFFSSSLSIIIFIFFIINFFIIMPKINKEADLNKKLKVYSKKFKILHTLSVILYVIQMLLCLIYFYYYFY